MSAPSTEATLTNDSRRRFWQQHVLQYRESGLSRKAYCREHNLVYHQLLYWEKKAPPSTPVATAPMGKLVPVEVIAPRQSVPLSVVLPNGVQIRVIEPCNLDTLGHLLEQLQ